MGIKNLFQLIAKHVPHAISKCKLADLAGTTLSVDVSILIYKWHLIGVSRGIRSRDGRLINHLQGLFYHVVNLRRYKITPIYCFDGPPPTVKGRTIAARKLRQVRVPSCVFADCKHLLDLMGMEWIDSPGEAEAQCVELLRARAAGVLSEDSDALAFGAAFLYRGGGSSSLLERISLRAVLEGLGMDQLSFVDLCIMLGSDYTGKLPGIGPARALELVREHRRIPAILRALGITEPVVGFDYVAAREALLRPKVIKYVRRAAHTGDVLEYLVAAGLSPARVRAGLSKIAI